MPSAEYRRAHPELVRMQSAAYRDRHREELRKKSREYTRAHPPDPIKHRTYMQQYRQSHREDAKAYTRAYYRAHRMEILAKLAADPVTRAARGRSWRERNKERIKLNNARYFASERGKISHRAAAKRRRAIHRQLREVAPAMLLTNDEWDRIVLLSRGKCFWCKRKMKQVTQDHIIPLSKGGLHVAENIVASCHKCNVRKNDKILTLF